MIRTSKGDVIDGSEDTKKDHTIVHAGVMKKRHRENATQM
jgi:hypothetical protein